MSTKALIYHHHQKLKEYHEHPEAATGGVPLKKVFLVRKIHRKTPVSESLF